MKDNYMWVVILQIVILLLLMAIFTQRYLVR